MTSVADKKHVLTLSMHHCGMEACTNVVFKHVSVQTPLALARCLSSETPLFRYSYVVFFIIVVIVMIVASM